MKNKRGSPKLFLIISIAVLVVGIAISLIFILKDPQNPITKIVNKLVVISTGNSGNNGTTIINGEEVPENSVSGSSDGAGGGGSGDSSSGQSCNTISAYHSIININREYNCNSYDGAICTDKTVTCSSEIHNNDFSISGTFVVELSFVEDGKSISDSIKKADFTFNLGPQDYAPMQDYARVQSAGVDGTANKDINCFYNVVSIPSQKICN
ncbi:MAG: hypothetical protein AABW51_02065 [Nanoarchaeota archaeon]